MSGKLAALRTMAGMAPAWAKPLITIVLELIGEMISEIEQLKRDRGQS